MPPNMWICAHYLWKKEEGSWALFSAKSWSYLFKVNVWTCGLWKKSENGTEGFPRWERCYFVLLLTVIGMSLTYQLVVSVATSTLAHFNLIMHILHFIWLWSPLGLVQSQCHFAWSREKSLWRWSWPSWLIEKVFFFCINTNRSGSPERCNWFTVKSHRTNFKTKNLS